jgi:hypothetical protein
VCRVGRAFLYRASSGCPRQLWGMTTRSQGKGTALPRESFHILRAGRRRVVNRRRVGFPCIVEFVPKVVELDSSGAQASLKAVGTTAEQEAPGLPSPSSSSILSGVVCCVPGARDRLAVEQHVNLRPVPEASGGSRCPKGGGMARPNWEIGLTRMYVVLVGVWVISWTLYLREAFTELSAWGPNDFKAAALIYLVCPLRGYAGLAASSGILRGFLSPRNKDAASDR